MVLHIVYIVVIFASVGQGGKRVVPLPSEKTRLRVIQAGRCPACSVSKGNELTTIFMEKYCISIDWLQVYCICNYLRGVRVSNGEEPANNEVIYLMREEIATALWLEVYSVYLGRVKVATLCKSPRSSAMDARGCTLKLENKVLYSHRWLEVLRRVMDDCGLIYKGITRIDLCYDCNRLAGGKSVQKFLCDYVTASPYQEGHIVRVGSRRFAVHARRNAGGAMEINSMRWGSQGSDIGAYCYNKSLELLEVKDKPWIRETWEKNGLINEWDNVGWRGLSEKKKKNAIENGDTTNYIHTSVWRWEISVKSHAKDILNIDTGELFTLSLEYLETQAAVEKLFYVYAAKAFHFRQSQGQRTVREYPDVTIFERGCEVSSRPYRITKLLDSGKTEKVCYNTLHKIMETYTDLSSAQLNSIQSAMDLLLCVAGKKSSAIRLQRQANFLNNMRAHKYLAYDDFLYLGSLEAARLAKRDIDAGAHYSFMRSLVDSVILSLDADKAAEEGIIVDGYPYGVNYSMPAPLYPIAKQLQ